MLYQKEKAKVKKENQYVFFYSTLTVQLPIKLLHHTYTVNKYPSLNSTITSVKTVLKPSFNSRKPFRI